MYFTGGPLVARPKSFSTFLGTQTALGLVVVMVFTNKDDRMIAGSIVVDDAAGTAQGRLVLIAATTRKTLAILPLPSEQKTAPRLFRPADIYFYLDQSDRLIAGTADRTIWVVSHNASTLSHDQTYDLRNIVPEGDSIQALQPDFSGRIWVTSKGGIVATLGNTGNLLGTLKTLQLQGERIANGHSADATGGVFIATQVMYRFDADPVTDAPTITWREPYDAGTHIKAGQVDIGTGTTEYVTIADNAEPRMHVLVYRRAKQVARSRLVCAEPVFKPGNGSTENSLVATDRSIVVENNFGYKSIDSTENGRTTKPGLTRIDLNSFGCRRVWTNEEESIPSVVTKMSLANGLIYTYTKPKGPANTDAWYFTTMDFETGKTVYQRLAGTGTLFNNHYAPFYLGPNGTAYVGVLGGIVAVRDTN